MTTGGWIFLVTCWTALIVMTFYCFRIVLSVTDKKNG